MISTARNIPSGYRRKQLAARPYRFLDHKTLEARLDGLRGMAWAYAVLSYTGLSASKASIVFGGNTSSDVKNSNIFYQYLRGERAPIRGPRGAYGLDLVGKVNEDVEGRKATPWLSHPIFEAFTVLRHADAVRLRTIRLTGPIKEAFDSSIGLKPLNEASVSSASIGSMDDFVFACRHYRWNLVRTRMRHINPSASATLFKKLAEEAGRCDPVFEFIRKPFLQMVMDFHLKDPLATLNSGRKKAFLVVDAKKVQKTRIKRVAKVRNSAKSAH